MPTIALGAIGRPRLSSLRRRCWGISAFAPLPYPICPRPLCPRANAYRWAGLIVPDAPGRTIPRRRRSGRAIRIGAVRSRASAGNAGFEIGVRELAAIGVLVPVVRGDNGCASAAPQVGRGRGESPQRPSRALMVPSEWRFGGTRGTASVPSQRAFAMSLVRVLAFLRLASARTGKRSEKRTLLPTEMTCNGECYAMGSAAQSGGALLSQQR
jgi:hypothetical protein